jgi:small neutral amino acid transporter SnatA (MarC family)
MTSDILTCWLLAFTVSGLVPLASEAVNRVFGRTGLGVMTRLMGLPVAVVGVRYVANGATPILRDGLALAALR